MSKSLNSFYFIFKREILWRHIKLHRTSDLLRGIPEIMGYLRTLNQLNHPFLSDCPLIRVLEVLWRPVIFVYKIYSMNYQKVILHIEAHLFNNSIRQLKNNIQNFLIVYYKCTFLLKRGYYMCKWYEISKIGVWCV